MLAFMAPRRWRLALLFAPSIVLAQLQGGQFFTPGLAIISSPAPESPFGVGSTLSIAISLSGQGNLTDFTPGGSTDGSGYDDLQLYFVSAAANINITISTNFLTQEPDQNVKHPEFRIPDCLPAGNYNLTLYERSRFKDVPLYVISQLPVKISNSNKGTTPCLQAASVNPVQAQPQLDSPLDGSPWLLGQVGRFAGTSKATLASKDAPAPELLGVNNVQQPQGGNRASSFTPLFEVTFTTAAPEPTPPPQAAATTRGSPNRSTFSIRTITITADLAEATFASFAPFNAANGPQGILFPVNSGALNNRLVQKGAWLLPPVALFLSHYF